MKKVIILMLCLLAVFAIVSCKQEPEKGNEPAPAVVENGGTLTVHATAEATWGNADRFQFIINQAFEDGDTIEFLLKLSDSFTSVVPRSANSANSYAKFATKSLSSLEKDEDGWYIVSAVATESFEKLAITCMLTGTQDENLFISIKNLKIGGELIDFTEFEEGTVAATFLGSPSALVGVVTQ